MASSVVSSDTFFCFICIIQENFIAAVIATTVHRKPTKQHMKIRAGLLSPSGPSADKRTGTIPVKMKSLFVQRQTQSLRRSEHNFVAVVAESHNLSHSF